MVYCSFNKGENCSKHSGTAVLDKLWLSRVKEMQDKEKRIYICYILSDNSKSGKGRFRGKKTNWGNFPVEDISNILVTNSTFSQRFPNIKVPTKIPTNFSSLHVMHIFFSAVKSTFYLLGKTLVFCTAKGPQTYTDWYHNPLFSQTILLQTGHKQFALHVKAVISQTRNLQVQENMDKSNRLLEHARGQFGCMNSALEEYQIGSLKKKLILLNISNLRKKLSW